MPGRKEQDTDHILTKLMVLSGERDYKRMGQYDEMEKFIQGLAEAPRKKWPILGSRREKGIRKGFTEEVIPELDLQLKFPEFYSPRATGRLVLKILMETDCRSYADSDA